MLHAEQGGLRHTLGLQGVKGNSESLMPAAAIERPHSPATREALTSKHFRNFTSYDYGIGAPPTGVITWAIPLHDVGMRLSIRFM